MIERVIPDIPKIRAHWERRSCPIPYLMVPMSDGTVVRYNAEMEHPGVQKALDTIRTIKRTDLGYPREERRMKHE